MFKAIECTYISCISVLLDRKDRDEIRVKMANGWILNKNNMTISEYLAQFSEVDHKDLSFWKKLRNTIRFILS